MKTKIFNLIIGIFIIFAIGFLFDCQIAHADIGIGDTGVTLPTSIGAGTDVSTSTTSTSGSTAGSSSGSVPLPAKPANLPSPSLESVVTFVVKVIWAIGQIGFVVVLLVGGVMFITAAGDEGKAEKAKKLILYAVIGLIVMLAAWGISSFLIKAFATTSS